MICPLCKKGEVFTIVHADYDCPLEDSNNECTQERAEKCWMDYWMGEEK